jgi:hypothetical protein
MTEERRLAESDRARILVTARLLEATATLDWLSTGMTLIAVASLDLELRCRSPRNSSDRDTSGDFRPESGRFRI